MLVLLLFLTVWANKNFSRSWLLELRFASYMRFDAVIVNHTLKLSIFKIDLGGKLMEGKEDVCEQWAIINEADWNVTKFWDLDALFFL